jgi:uncharacterized protein (DUF2062 family)
MVFVAFYFIGRKINLASELKSVIVALLIGEVAAHFAFLSFATLWTISQNIGIGINSIFALLSFLPNPFTMEFFVALAALSVSYIKRSKSTQSITSSAMTSF